MNNQIYKDHHIGNLSRLVGHPVTRYEYMLSQDELVDAWVKAHAELGYPLKKQSYRDRYLIYNKQGLEKEIEKIITELIINSEKILVEMLREDATQVMQELADSINVVNNQVVINKPSNQSSFGSKVGRYLGKAIAQATKKIVKELTKDNNNR